MPIEAKIEELKAKKEKLKLYEISAVTGKGIDARTAARINKEMAEVFGRKA